MFTFGQMEGRGDLRWLDLSVAADTWKIVRFLYAGLTCLTLYWKQSDHISCLDGVSRVGVPTLDHIIHELDQLPC